jgi:hypothetical protein
MLHKKKQTILMRSNVQERTHVLLVNHTIPASPQLLRSWCGQRPCNKYDLDSSVTWEVGKSIRRGWSCSCIVVLQYASFDGFRFKWYTLYKSEWYGLSRKMSWASRSGFQLRGIEPFHDHSTAVLLKSSTFHHK